ncbi:MAG: type II toxin-antitoxin system VapB family antitoxin [Mobilicoccus sp.]|nr:type II toxin-antitoxin system VapB family antitoxin [Mobilicoccus sp.]
MALNIKNERVHELARRAAKATDSSLTSAIEQGLVLLLRQHGEDPDDQARHRLDAARAIADAYHADPGEPTPGLSRIEDLYDDESGLPR